METTLMKILLRLLPLILSSSLLLPRLDACPVWSIEFEPQRPTSKDEIYALVTGSGVDPNPEILRIRTTPEKIAIVVECDNLPISAVTPWSERIRIGRLPAGVYDVATGPDTPFRTTLVVRDEPFGLGPTSGRAGTKVLLDRLVVVDDMVVRFGDVVAPFVRVQVQPWRARQAVVTAPSHAPGLVDVTVTYPSGDTLTFRDGFRYVSSDQELEYERVMFPVTYYGEGVNGSRWQTDIVIGNVAPVAVHTFPLTDGDLPITPTPGPISANGHARFPLDRSGGGAFLYVPRGLEKYLAYSAHARDVSRFAVDRGTEIPVIRPTDTAPVLRIINVLVGGEFRAMLRVYDFDSVERDLTVTITRQFTPSVVRQVKLRGVIHCVVDPCLQPSPTWASIDLGSFEGPGIHPVDITVEDPSGEAPRLWGFVSVTHNETQFVTTYSPHHRTGGDL
jgi:hypothetical protein